MKSGEQGTTQRTHVPFYGRLLVETKLITRRGCGGSVSTPSADEGRLFIKSHVSRVPRRPINSPWRFLLWPWTDLIHISSTPPPPSACFLAAAFVETQYSIDPRTHILWHSWSFTCDHGTNFPRKQEGVTREYNDLNVGFDYSDISYLLGDLPNVR